MTKSEEYREGDLIRATKNGEAMQGKLRPYQSTLGLDEAGWGLDSLEKYGWIVELIERGPDPQPTEWGAYFDKDGDLWVRDRDGVWHDFTSGLETGSGQSYPARYAPFTKLYTKDEVIAKARKAASSIDPDYVFGGPEQVLIMELQHVL